MKTKRPNKKSIRYFFLAAIALMLTFAALAQHKTGTYNILVKGTSNLHDWTMKAAGTNLDGNIVVAKGVITGVSATSFTMPVKNLKSGESLMDKRAYDALKADKYLNVVFNLVSATITGAQSGKATLNVIAQLTIAGNTRQLTMPATAVVGTDGSITVTGVKKLKMSEFGIKPPTFMLGALKVGDELNIEYSAKFK